ncbi:hypothetical protein [Candidatus Berkiella aquae]|uniref:Uncharacterized protein n=1 Tax=Candidatus Berkiella aquae TaxID=295108 RepID=A0A0Q9YJT5_9GAMM|nr:hypothetical protein [Candidatus Berkiella aquae]MCS5711369.1 hypothetical protein [Candidatus Berkiella aquae]
MTTLTTEQDLKLIENPVRLSESKLWLIQRNYFATMGINAWKEEVPFYISSNAFIGHQYALLVIEFIKDTRRNHPQTEHETFYIAEFGSGTGLFSFYFLKAFTALLEIHGISEQKFCYIITDIVEKNIEFCQKNNDFKPYLDKNQLDFASFNVEEDQDFHLRIRKKSYSELQGNAPLVLIANYVFDCVKQDAFDIFKGKLQEEKIGIRSRYKNFDIEHAKHLNELRFDYQSYDVDIEHYYENPYIKEILQDYTANLPDVSIMMPLGAFLFFDHLKKLTNGNYFMIAGDKGYSTIKQFPLYRKKQRISYDGCYSFFVNFHAMGEYNKKIGGDCLLTQNHNNFQVCLFNHGDSFTELKNTTACFKTYLESLGPDEYCYLFDEYLTNSYRFYLRSLMSFLRLSHWDPIAYAAIHERLVELVPVCENHEFAEVLTDLEKVRNNIYHINVGEDVLEQLGVFYQIKNMDEIALQLYEQSIQTFGDREPSYNNSALIYDKQKNTSKALYNYQKAYGMNKKNKFAYRRIAQLTGKPNFYSFLPLIKLTFVLAVMAGVLYLLGRH